MKQSMSKTFTSNQDVLYTSVKTGTYQSGLDFFDKLQIPTLTDLRWAGMCCFALAQYARAESLLRRAVQLGHEVARIELACTLRFSGDKEQGKKILNELDVSNIAPNDAIRYYRERAMIALETNDFEIAISEGQSAWMLVQFSDEKDWLGAAIAQLLAHSYAEIGRHIDAKWAVEELLRCTMSPHREASARLTYAGILSKLGHFDEARANLENTSYPDESTAIKFHRAQVTGEFFWLQRKYQQAAVEFEHAATIARDLNKDWFVQTCFQASNAWCGINNTDRARANLSATKKATLFPALDLEYAITEGHVALKTDFLDHALEKLEYALVNARQLQRFEQEARCRLFLAEYQFRTGQLDKTKHELDCLADLIHAIGHARFIEGDLGCVSERDLKKIASKYAKGVIWLEVVEVKDKIQFSETALNLRAFGQPALFVNGRPLPLPPRALELLCYLYFYPGSTTQKIATSLKPDTTTKKSSALFHQLKHVIHAANVGIHIVQDELKMYHIESNSLSLTVDTKIFQQLLSKPSLANLEQALEIYGGQFLPNATSEWAEEVRNDMEWLLISSGVSVIQKLVENNQFESARNLSKRLLKLEPIDDALNQLLVTATEALEGPLVAMQELQAIQERYRSFGSLPPALQKLQTTLIAKLN